MKSFQVTLEDIREVADKLTAAFKKGLEDEKDAVVKMFITYVHSLPDGTEEGDFLALDLGGSNFRVLQLSEQSPSLSLSSRRRGPRARPREHRKLSGPSRRGLPGRRSRQGVKTLAQALFRLEPAKGGGAWFGTCSITPRRRRHVSRTTSRSTYGR